MTQANLNQPTSQEVILTDLIYSLTAKCVRINRLGGVLATFCYNRQFIALNVYENLGSRDSAHKSKPLSEEVYLKENDNWQAELEALIERLEQFVRDGIAEAAIGRLEQFIQDRITEVAQC